MNDIDFDSIKNMRSGDGRSLRAALLWLNTLMVTVTIFLFWWDRTTIALIDVVITLLLVMELAAHWVWVRDQENAERKAVPPVDDETAQNYYHETKAKRREETPPAAAAYRVIKHNERRDTDQIEDAEYAYPDTLADDEAEAIDMKQAYIGEDGEIYYVDEPSKRTSRL